MREGGVGAEDAGDAKGEEGWEAGGKEDLRELPEEVHGAGDAGAFT